MPVIATEPKRLSDLVKTELWASAGYCRKVVTVDTGSGFDLAFGTVLGTADSGATYVPAVETAVDGSKVAAAIYIGTVDGAFGVDATIAAAGTDVIALVKGPAIVGADSLVLDATYNNATKVGVVHAKLESLGINVVDQL